MPPETRIDALADARAHAPANASADHRLALLGAGALVANAFVWGTSWWPFRWLAERGLHPLWATALCYALAMVVIVAVRPGAIRQLATTPALWAIMAAAGVTNATFNWGVTQGDVLRVVLLFYVMPVWSVLLARWLLGERITRASLARVTLAVAGALVVLWPAEGAWPRGLADALGLAGGFSFALTTVLLRRERHRAEEGRALAMFGGGAVVAGGLALVLGVAGGVALPPAPSAGWIAMLAALAVCFLFGNLALQYGTARLTAQRTAVIMLVEVVFAATSSVLLGASAPTWPMAIGGALIVASSLLAARRAATSG